MFTPWEVWALGAHALIGGPFDVSAATVEPDDWYRIKLRGWRELSGPTLCRGRTFLYLVPEGEDGMLVQLTHYSWRFRNYMAEPSEPVAFAYRC